MSVYETLAEVNVSKELKKKGGLSYLSWVYAWGELLKRYPDSQYTVYENADGWNYHTDGKTAWVKTGVTVNGKEYIEMLPVMDYKNQAIPVNNITSVDVNKAIQRSITKAIARHGLGLYIYAGEDIPRNSSEPLPSGVKLIGEKEIATLKQNAREAYGDDWAHKLAYYLEEYGADRPDQLSQADYKAINKRMYTDYKIKVVNIK